MTDFVDWASLQHFDRSEFVRPEMMDADLLGHVDELRERCGFPLRVTSDGRTDGDLEAIYGPKGDWPRWLTERGSPHARGHAVDVVPVADSVQQRDERRAKVFVEAFRMWEEGRWPRCGIEFADAHVHLDNDPELRRPHFWPGASK